MRSAARCATFSDRLPRPPAVVSSAVQAIALEGSVRPRFGIRPGDRYRRPVRALLAHPDDLVVFAQQSGDFGSHSQREGGF